MTDVRTLHVQITLELPEADARELLAEIQDHAARDTTDGHRDSGLVMVPSEAIRRALLANPADPSNYLKTNGVIELWTR